MRRSTLRLSVHSCWLFLALFARARRCGGARRSSDPQRHDLRRSRARPIARRRRSSRRQGRRGRAADRLHALTSERGRRAVWRSRPGFINMLSWATESLIHDGRGMSDIKQGVTLEIFGEGSSYGPVNDAHPRGDAQDAGRHPLRRHLDHARRVPRVPGRSKGVSPNVASFVGATTVREHELGFADRAPTAEELQAHAGAGAAGDARGRARRRQLADLCAGFLCEDRRADRARRRRPASSAAATSRTCAAKATASSRRSTS